jgi:hypothetical protein
MSWLNSILTLVAVFLALFIQATEGAIRYWLGTPLNLLPAIMVHAGLRGNLTLVALLAIIGGLGFDSLSANPLGVSLLPLFVVGLVIHIKRDLILRDQFIAQFMLGLAASAAVPGLTLLLLLTGGQRPLLGWGSLWQLAVMAAAGAFFTPFVFRCFDLGTRALSYRPLLATSFRSDREIRRGRS